MSFNNKKINIEPVSCHPSAAHFAEVGFEFLENFCSSRFFLDMCLPAQLGIRRRAKVGFILMKPKHWAPPNKIIWATWFPEFMQSCVYIHRYILLTYPMVQNPSSEANWFAASQEIICLVFVYNLYHPKMTVTSEWVRVGRWELDTH